MVATVIDPAATDEPIAAEEQDDGTPSSQVDIATLGTAASEVTVSIGPQFLQLFSEKMYSSPNKAFEELVSNSWDAGAGAVHIGLSDDLEADGACVWVLDNGESMDEEGFTLLWNVANSTKPTRDASRPQIGKFGIGKLSTFLLADELTYVCRAADGVMRAVTMDYRRITSQAAGLHIEAMPLSVRVLTRDDLETLLKGIDGGSRILGLIDSGVPAGQPSVADEFGPGSGEGKATEPDAGTWTLVIVSSLKPTGRAMQRGVIRRMLRTALPLGDSISISYCNEDLLSTKLDTEVAEEWQVGPGLGIEQLEIPGDVGEPPTVLAVTELSDPYPHLVIEGIEGRVTGSVRLFADPISGGKSSGIAASNGFFVNVLGRVINPTDPYFGLANLNHAAWARMRTAVRVDGLNGAISVDRESVSDAVEVAITRALLRALFNRARSAHDAVSNAAWPDAGAVLTDAWGTIPLDPLRRILDDRFAANSEPPAFLIGFEEDDDDFVWEGSATSDVIEDVVLAELGPEGPLVAYQPKMRRVEVNTDHPFSREHGETHEEQVLLRDSGLVELLTQAFMLEIGFDDDTLAQVVSYRDQLFRLVARIRRRSAFQLAELLDNVTSDWQALERAVAESLEYLGFVVDHKSGSGEPEGVAAAPLTPGKGGKPRRYTFTYDAKASKDGKVANGDVKAAGLLRHRQKYEADFTLIVGPDFARGGFDEDCVNNELTPMRASDLSALLLIHATKGPIDLEEMRSLFELRDLDEVHDWVVALSARLDEVDRLSFSDFFAALASVGFEEPDALTSSVIAREIRSQRGSTGFPNKREVEKLVDGLQVMVPNLIRRVGSQIMLGAEPTKLRDSVVSLLDNVPDRYEFAASAVK